MRLPVAAGSGSTRQEMMLGEDAERRREDAQYLRIAAKEGEGCVAYSRKGFRAQFSLGSKHWSGNTSRKMQTKRHSKRVGGISSSNIFASKEILLNAKTIILKLRSS